MFALMNVFLSFGNYDVFATNLFWPDTRLQYARYIADRVGVMSIANIPLVWLFATRNNLISYITGWPFETVIQFHRWIAIIATAQAIVHSIAYTVAAFLIGGLQQYQLLWLQRYWACGGLATFTMSVMVAFSVHPLMRKWFYEMFLFFHGVFAVVVLVGLWYHIEVFGGAYNGFLWPCIIVWVVDRLARLVRVFRLNSRFRKSIATYRTESDVLWLNVPSTERSPTAGSYYFLYVLHGFTCYQSHPFTLAGWEKREEDLTTMLTFAIRPYHGLTARLRDLVKSGLGSDPEKSGQSLIRVLVEGPYSPRHSLTLYDGLTFIVGGTGIAVALSYISGALAAVHDKSNKVRYNFRRFQLIWTVREQTFFQDTFDREIRPRLTRLSQLTTTHNLQISVHIYMTGLETSMMPMVETDTEVEAESENLLEMQQLLCCKDLTTSENGAGSHSTNELSINSSLLTSNTWTGNVDSEDIELRVFTRSRPRLENIVMTSASHDDAANNQGRYAIVACGPTSMADDTRMAVVKAVGLGYYIDFYSESYSW
jgi:predicted ferric reductase